MLCLQQCIDLCDVTPEQAQAIREYATLAEIAAIQAECPHAQAAADGAAGDALPTCQMLDIRDQLLDEVRSAEDFADLDRVVHRYCAYLEARDGRTGGAR